MDLGIKGRKAVVEAASKGLGKGCAMALAEEGVDLVINARTESELMATAEEIRKATGVTVTPVVADVTTPEGRKAILRSEEHTSELQSLMRNSYAVFCLKKKKTTKPP